MRAEGTRRARALSGGNAVVGPISFPHTRNANAYRMRIHAGWNLHSWMWSFGISLVGDKGELWVWWERRSLVERNSSWGII